MEDNVDIKRQQKVTFRMNGSRFTPPFLVCSRPTTAAGLLGTDFLSRLFAKLDFDRGKMSINDGIFGIRSKYRNEAKRDGASERTAPS